MSSSVIEKCNIEVVEALYVFSGLFKAGNSYCSDWGTPTFTTTFSSAHSVSDDLISTIPYSLMSVKHS